ncbi:MAG: SpoIIE family protein phosphatase [Candidatus Eremiobacteraeota bacterium]|nr:SpoIIE family protein phosphatase [Candidatus Eremiobacteraeota bacterium]
MSIVPLVSFIVLLGFVLRLQQTTQTTSYWSQHSEQVLAEADAAMRSLDDANTAATRYLKTGDAGFLPAYRSASAAMNAHAVQLQRLVSDNPQQTIRAAHLAGLLIQAGSVLDRYVAATQQHHTAEAIAMGSSPSTLRLGAEILATKAAFDSAERTLAIQRFQWYGTLLQRFSREITVVLVAGILLTLLAMLAFGLRIVRRLNHLSKNAERIESGVAPVALAGNDEIALLDQRYREMAVRLRHEHDVASILQRALLPQQLPEVPGIRIDCAYTSAGERERIGGDWYDVFELSPNTIGISMGDVAGHGLRSAAIMATTRQSLRTAARLAAEPSQVMMLANRLLCEEEGSSLATGFFGLFDVTTGLLKYSLAGHPPPLLVSASGNVDQLEGKGLMLGIDVQARYDERQAMLETGSALVLFTDGVIEMTGDYDLGMRNLIAAVNAEYYNTAGNIAEAIERRILKAAQLRDDAAIMFIGATELKAAPLNRTKTWTIDANAASAGRRVKRALLWHLGQYARPGTDLSPVELIYGELIGNVMRHTPGHAEVTLDLEDGKAVLHVCDRGAAFNPEPGPADVFAEGGRGLFLIRSLADDLRVERFNGGNRVSATLPIRLDHTEAYGRF